MIFRESFVKDQHNFAFHIQEWIPSTPPKGLVFLLHGLSDHGGRFRHVGERMSHDGFVFFAPDLRGNGLSDGKRGHFDSLPQVMDDFEFLFSKMKTTFGGIPSFIYGQSMGGNLALNFCMRRKPRALGVISSSPWLQLAKEPGILSRFAGSTIGTLFPALSVSDRLNASDLTHDSYISKLYRNDPLVHGKITLNTYKIISESGKWALKNPEQLELPLLLLHGTGDKITSFESSRKFSSEYQKSSTFRSFQGLFHELHNEFEKTEIISGMISWMESMIITNQGINAG